MCILRHGHSILNWLAFATFVTFLSKGEEEKKSVAFYSYSPTSTTSGALKGMVVALKKVQNLRSMELMMRLRKCWFTKLEFWVEKADKPLFDFSKKTDQIYNKDYQNDWPETPIFASSEFCLQTCDSAYSVAYCTRPQGLDLLLSCQTTNLLTLKSRNLPS